VITNRHKQPIRQISTGGNTDWTPLKTEFLLKLCLYGGAAALTWFFYRNSRSELEADGEEPHADPHPEDYSSWEPEQ
jgi:hypothetical protein